MKKNLISVLCILLGTIAQAEQNEYTYTTQNGYGTWTLGNTSPTDNLNRGRYDSYSFTLNEDSFDKTTPYGEGASLTTGAFTDGSTVTPEDTLAMDDYFKTGNYVSLTQISFKGENKDNTSFTADTYLRITLDTGETFTSSVVSQSQSATRDPWYNSWFHTNDVGVFSFTDDIVLEIGVQYSLHFVDAAGNVLTANSRPYLDVTQAGDSGFSAGGTAWSPAGMSITTTSIIPEPSVGALSLLTLAGFVARRRRKA